MNDAESGRSHEGRGIGRGRGRGRRNRHPFPTRTRSDKAFKGNTVGMNGHVFEGYGETIQKQQYSKTVEALAGYISKTMNYPKDLASIYKNYVLTEVEEPADLTETEEKSAIKRLIWKNGGIGEEMSEHFCHCVETMQYTSEE